MTDAPGHAGRQSQGLLRALTRLAFLGGFAWLFVVVVFAWEQRSLIYQPAKGPVAPNQWGLGLSTLEEVAIPTVDGLLLHGWLLFADHPPEDHARKLVILFSGNAGHRGYRAEILRNFQQFGCDVLICDYRGYAENAGRPTEELLVQDAHLIWRFAWKRGYLPSQIVVCGQSLGGGVGTRLAAELCREGTPPAGLILRGTFTSLTDVGRYHYPWLPIGLVLLDRFESSTWIREVSCPILVVHGDQDMVVPFTLGRRLFEAAPETSAEGIAKSFLPLPDVGHDEMLLEPSREEQLVWSNFLDAIFGTREPEGDQ